MPLGGKSIMDCTVEDFIKAGFYTRANLTRNGVPSGIVCHPTTHIWDLAEEDGILYIYCTKCQTTKVLSPHTTLKEREHEKDNFSVYRLEF